ncbi:MAG: pentapeptide repeat-containing protein, partial [Oscillochloris sp.]|nr:pentapeptide repeat-containing protein [Oscillochloris sp.]
MRLLFWRALQLLLIFASLSGLTLYISLNPVRCLPDCMGANLSGSTLNRANLSNANFVEATLSSAALEGVVFTGTNLSGAT